MNFRQHIAGFFEKVGVFGQKDYAPIDFVGDALAGAVSAVEQFEVLDSIVSPVAVDVMDSFARAEWPIDLSLHVVAMFENFYGFLVRVSSNRDTHVAVSCGSRNDFSIGVGLQHDSRVKFVSAFFVANFSPEIKVVRAVTVDCWKRFAAVEAFASFLRKLFRTHSPSYVRAFSTAIFRVLTPLLSVRAKLTRGEAELFLAVLAREIRSFYLSFGASLSAEISEVALSAAKLVRFTRVFYLEWFPAVNARIYQGSVPFMSVHDWYRNRAASAISVFAGAL